MAIRKVEVIKSNLTIVRIGVIGTTATFDVGPDFAVYLGYDPNELSYVPTILSVFKYTNYTDKLYEVYEPELTGWLYERLKQ